MVEQKRRLSRRDLVIGGAAAAGAATLGWLLRRRPAGKQHLEARQAYDNKRVKLHLQFAEPEGFEMRSTREAKVKPHVICPDPESFIGGPTPVQDFNEAREWEQSRFGQVGKAKVFFLERFTPNEAKTLSGLYEKADEAHSNAHFAFIDGRASEAINKYGEYLEANRDILRRRSEALDNTLSNLHYHLVKRFPELESESEIAVSIRYLPVHAHLAQSVLKHGFGSVNVEHSSKSLTPGEAQTLEIIKGKKYSREEIGRALVTSYLASRAMDREVRAEDWHSVAGILASKLSLNDIAQLSNATKFDEEAKFFRSKKLTLPQSRQEVEEFLRKHRTKVY